MQLGSLCFWSKTRNQWAYQTLVVSFIMRGSAIYFQDLWKRISVCCGSNSLCSGEHCRLTEQFIFAFHWRNFGTVHFQSIRFSANLGMGLSSETPLHETMNPVHCSWRCEKNKIETTYIYIYLCVPNDLPKINEDSQPINPTWRFSSPSLWCGPRTSHSWYSWAPHIGVHVDAERLSRGLGCQR